MASNNLSPRHAAPVKREVISASVESSASSANLVTPSYSMSMNGIPFADAVTPSYMMNMMAPFAADDAK